MIDPVEMKTIDPVECCLAVVGVESIVSREVEKVNLTQVKLMENLNKRCYTEARLIVKGEKSSVPLTTVPYKKMLGLLTEKFDAVQLEEMVAKFPPALHGISGDFLIKANQVVELLRGLFPMSVKDTLLGPESIMPSALAVRKFAVLLDVLNDPMRVFAHIACGSLLKSQSEIIREVYPEFSECVTDALTEAGTDAKAAKKSFQLPARVEIGYGVWAGIPRVNPRLQSRLQKNFAKADEEQAKPQGETGSSTSVAAKEALTQTQSATFPHAMKG